MDYKALGLKVGLEIHQQLDTHKLFCSCQSRLSEDVRCRFHRRLRPTQSELGEVDAAAVEEAMRKLRFTYEVTDNTCLVEADEEPPQAANREAIDAARIMALLLDASPVEEIHFMRKIVIDGSNTTGFQRSALIAMDGHLDVDGKRIGIPTILLEEDAARKVEERKGEVVYRLDRLGIPLIEISTTPDIETPREAVRVALAIGSLLRATKRVKRQLGAIREDLNISIAGGARTEVKGVQELRMVSTFVEKEVERQLMLLDVASKLKARGVGEINAQPVDVSSIFEETVCKVISSSLKGGGKVLGVRLAGFAGLLGGKLGPELAAHARVAGVGGIFHSDELPAYGISASEFDRVRKMLDLSGEDAFVLIADDEEKASIALLRVIERASRALSGVPNETRDPRPDGTTVYSRPLPGRARMYPETDVQPIRVTEAYLERLRLNLPERPEAKIPRISREYGLHEQQARQLVEDGMDDVFEELARHTRDRKLLATTLLYTFTELRREGVDVDSISTAALKGMLEEHAKGRVPKEVVPDVLRGLARGRDLKRVLTDVGVAVLSDEQLKQAVDEILLENKDLVDERGEKAHSALMGIAMERLRGRVSGKKISEMLRSILKEKERK